jgi:hypothetical protein
MKRIFLFTMVMAILLVVCCSCVSSYEPDFRIFWDDFTAKYEKVEVCGLGQSEGWSFNGQLKGSFLVFNGNINGETTTIIRFAWQSNENPSHYYFTEISFSKVERVQGDGIITADFSLAYPEDYSYSDSNSKMNDYWRYYRTSELEKMTPNEVISFWSSGRVVFTMTDEQYSELLKLVNMIDS